MKKFPLIWIQINTFAPRQTSKPKINDRQFHFEARSKVIRNDNKETNNVNCEENILKENRFLKMRRTLYIDRR